MEVYSDLVKPNAPGAKKRFGQHFLRDTGVIDRIVRWIQPGSVDSFLEIGAGDGAISKLLAPRVSRYIALEIDLDRIPLLTETLSPFPSAIVVPGDFLQLELSGFLAAQLPPSEKIRVAGNLPYNIATVIIEKLLQNAHPVQDMHFMVQLEVAQRITANPGSKEYGFFSVYCQHHAHVEMGFKVSSACFVPRPKVTSAMVALHPKQRVWNPPFEAAFDEVVKAAFNYRRKTLSNSLSRHAALGAVSDALISHAGINGSARAEELTIQQYEHLASVYWEEFQNGGQKSTNL